MSTYSCPNCGPRSSNQYTVDYRCIECGSGIKVIDTGSRTIRQLEERVAELTAVEEAWERAMMEAIGEDGIQSVVEAIGKLKAERDEYRQQAEGE